MPCQPQSLPSTAIQCPPLPPPSLPPTLQAGQSRCLYPRVQPGNELCFVQRRWAGDCAVGGLQYGLVLCFKCYGSNVFEAEDEKKGNSAMGSFLILDVVTYIVVTNINLIISSVPRCSSLIRFCSVHFYKKRKTNVQTGRRIIKRVIANFSQ